MATDIEQKGYSAMHDKTFTSTTHFKRDGKGKGKENRFAPLDCDKGLKNQIESLLSFMGGVNGEIKGIEIVLMISFQGSFFKADLKFHTAVVDNIYTSAQLMRYQGNQGLASHGIRCFIVKPFWKTDTVIFK